MIGTFAAILVFTMLKEGWEDIARHRSDKELNNKKTLAFDHAQNKFVPTKWANLATG